MRGLSKYVFRLHLLLNERLKIPKGVTKDLKQSKFKDFPIAN